MSSTKLSHVARGTRVLPLDPSLFTAKPGGAGPHQRNPRFKWQGHASASELSGLRAGVRSGLENPPGENVRWGDAEVCVLGAGAARWREYLHQVPSGRHPSKEGL